MTVILCDMNANLAQLKVLKYLQRHGIPVLNKRIKAHEFCIEDLDDDHEKQLTDVYNSKLLTKDRITLPEPYSLKSDWPTLALVIASISSSVRSVWTAVSTYRG